MIWYVTAEGEACGSSVGGSWSSPSTSVPPPCGSASRGDAATRVSNASARTTTAGRRSARNASMIASWAGSIPSGINRFGESEARSLDDDGVGEPVEIRVPRDESSAETPGGGIHERVGHGETVGEGHVRRFERQGFVHGGDGGAPKHRHRFDGALLADIPSNDLVDLVHLDRADEERL